MRSTYFSHGTHAEKRLYEDLIIEQLKVFGHDVYYMPREELSRDDVLGNTTDKFTDAYSIEMYVEDVNGFAGQGDLVGKFGIEVRDELTFVVSRRQFEILVEQPDNTLSINRPREGDVIFFPLNNKMYTVNFVEHEPVFYQMGSLQTYDLRCELFEFSNERFETGIPEVDDVFKPLITTGDDAVANNYTLQEVDNFADNFTIESEADNILDFSTENPFGESNY